jgi:hypothetical protein
MIFDLGERNYQKFESRHEIRFSHILFRCRVGQNLMKQGPDSGPSDHPVVSETLKRKKKMSEMKDEEEKCKLKKNHKIS